MRSVKIYCRTRCTMCVRFLNKTQSFIQNTFIKKLTNINFISFKRKSFVDNYEYSLYVHI